MIAFRAVALVFAMAMSPFGLYHHVNAPDLNSASTRQDLLSNFSLVTIRGDNGSTDGGLGTFLANRGNTKAILYRRGTAVGDDDAAAFTRDHPDWLARDRSGAVVTSNAGGSVIDITKPEVRAWLVSGVQRDVKAGAYDGVYLDVLGSFFSERFYSARPVINGAPLQDTAWRDASVALIREVKAATGKLVIANGFGIQGGNNYAQHKADSDQLIAAADGIQIEQFVRNGNMATSQYAPPARWRADVQLLEDVGRMNKIVLADTRVRDASDTAAVDQQRTYALASFLVGAEGPARFRFATGAATGDVDSSIADTINALGTPEGDAVRSGGGLTRRFSGGTVTVDPTTHDASIDVRNAGGGADARPGPSPSRRTKNTSSGFNFVAGAIGALAVLAIYWLFRTLRSRRTPA